MLGGIFKLALSFSTLFLFVTLLWQASIADALPTLAADDNVVKANADVSRLFSHNSHTGAIIVKRSLHSTVDQQMLIDRSSFPLRTYNKNLRAAKRIKAALDNRLKRFRMLDQDEFQEMLKSLSQQTAEEQAKASNGMDTIGGMQLANYWLPI